MQNYTVKTLAPILDRFGFITQDDMAALLADDRTRSRNVLIRSYDERVVVPLNEALPVIEAATERGTIRDVAFTSDECRRLRAELANLRITA